MASGRGRGIKAGDAYVIMDMDNEPFTTKQAEMIASFDDLGDKMTRAGTGAAVALGAMMAALIVSVNEAGLYEAALRRIELTYSDLADAQSAWMADFQTHTLRGKKQIAEMVATFGGFTKGLGFANDDAAFLAQGLSRISSAMSTFASISLEESAQRFRSAMAGSSEVLDMLGINIKEAALNQALLGLGFGKISDGATEQQKILARYMIILQSMQAQGSDLADVLMFTLPRGIQMLKGAFSDFMIGAGRPFLALGAKIIYVLVDFMKTVTGIVTSFPKATVFVVALAMAITALGASYALIGVVAITASKAISAYTILVNLSAAATNGGVAANQQYALSFLKISMAGTKVVAILTTIIAAFAVLAIATDRSKDGMSNLAMVWAGVAAAAKQQDWAGLWTAIIDLIQIAAIQMGQALLRTIGMTLDKIRALFAGFMASLWSAIGTTIRDALSILPDSLVTNMGINMGSIDDAVAKWEEHKRKLDRGDPDVSLLAPEGYIAQEIAAGERRADEYMQKYEKFRAQRKKAAEEEQKKVEEEMKRIQEMAGNLAGEITKAGGGRRGPISALDYRSVAAHEQAYQNEQNMMGQTMVGLLDTLNTSANENKAANKETAANSLKMAENLNAVP